MNVGVTLCIQYEQGFEGKKICLTKVIVLSISVTKTTRKSYVVGEQLLETALLVYSITKTP